MATTVYFLCLLITLSVLLLRTSGDDTLHMVERRHPNGVKSLHFTVYLQETFNRTAYFIVKGVAGPTGITTTSNPFGSLFAFHDPFTVSPDPKSKVVGTSEGSAVTSSFDGDRTTCISRFVLNLKGYKGEILNVGTADYTKESELPMVGGTGDFRYVQGYISTSAIKVTPPTTCYKIEFHLYWPPYTALFAKDA